MRRCLCRVRKYVNILFVYMCGVCIPCLFLSTRYRYSLSISLSLSLSRSLSLTESVPMNYISVVRTMFTCVEFVFPVCFNQPDPDKSLSLTASDLMNCISVIRI